jgi:hypothetical protein
MLPKDIHSLFQFWGDVAVTTALDAIRYRGPNQEVAQLFICLISCC